MTLRLSKTVCDLVFDQNLRLRTLDIVDVSNEEMADVSGCCLAGSFPARTGKSIYYVNKTMRTAHKLSTRTPVNVATAATLGLILKLLLNVSPRDAPAGDTLRTCSTSLS